jgi:hypothetical protein
MPSPKPPQKEAETQTHDFPIEEKLQTLRIKT